MSAVVHTLHRLERHTLGDRVYADLRELLIAGDLAPGDKVSLRRIADALGVSVMPVREAVSRLVADEALEVLPNRAISVPLIDIAKFQELTTVRVAIEGFAAAHAASARTKDDLAAMRRHQRAFETVANARYPDLGEAVRANKALHFAVYHATRLPSLVTIVQGLWLKIGPVLNLDLKASPDRLRTSQAHSAHARLIEAIESGDADAARAALVADIEGAAAFIAGTGRLAG